MNEIEIRQLTGFIRCMNSCIDSGKYRDVSVEEVMEHIKAGTIFKFLWGRLIPEARQLSVFEPEDQPIFVDNLQRFQDAYGDGRKILVYNNGLNLLLGWANEMIQGGHFEPDEDWDWVLVEEDDED